jgi:phosphatidate phosphatase APP1
MNKKILIISDFDDTIFSREEQLDKEQILRENR